MFRLWDEAVGEEVNRLFGQSYDLPLGWENTHRLGVMTNGSLLPDGHSPACCSADRDLW